jgi:hypothetical protein
MGYNAYTVNELVNNVLLIGHVPLGNSTFTAPTLITLADREIQLPIMKQILSSRGGYYLTYVDMVSNATGLYVIPSDCIGGALANIELIVGPTIIPVNEIEESEQFSTTSPSSSSYGYYMIGNYVQILPVPSNGNPRFWYFKRPSTLVPATSCCQISGIAGTAITVMSVPTNIVNGALVDLIGDQPPFNVLSTQTILGIVGTTITLDAAPLTLSNGNWIALSQQTPVPQIPVEFRPLLEQRVVSKIYELQGYKDKWQASQQILKDLEAATLSLITPRVKNNAKIIMPINGGFLSGRRGTRNFPAGGAS